MEINQMNMTRILNLRFLIILTCAMLISCSPVNTSPRTNTQSPTAIPRASTQTPPTPPKATPLALSDFSDPDPEIYVSLMPAIREYFYYRKQAVISGNSEELLQHYPGLSQNIDIQAGINAEEFHVKNYQGLQPFDGNILPEYYERIIIKETPEGFEVLLHGMELYLWRDGNNFDESGGEFKILLYLRQEDEVWTVYKTDQVTQMEWHQSLP
jgi:hypothetical protein